MIAKDINLNSQAWCDLVFNEKNKEYGAYILRKESSDRHLKALLIVAALGASLAFGVSAINKHNSEKLKNMADDFGSMTMTQVDVLPKDDPIIEQIKKLSEPEQPLVRKTIQFNPPVIVENEREIKNELVTQEELTLNKDALIAGVTREGSTDPNAVVITEPTPIVIETGNATSGKIEEHVEQMPIFPGGQTELMKYLSEKIKYPIIAQEQDIQGTVVLRFVVNKDGSVSDIQVLRSLDPSCDKEAKRVIASMPNWIPGKQNGMAVRVYFTVPVRFKLASR